MVIMPTARRAAVAAALLLALPAAPAAAAPGDLDPTFGGDGIVTAAPGSSSSLHGLTLSGDAIAGAGAVVGACRVAAVARWRADGTPDASFGAGGISAPALGPCDEVRSSDSLATAVVATPGGGLLASGGLMPSHRYTGLLVAFAMGGGLDPAFSGDGWLTDDFEDVPIADVVRLPDGRLVAGGSSYAIGRANWEVHRYLSGGGRDAAFDNDGAATYPTIAGAPQEHVHALTADGADGTVVAVGSSRTAGSAPRTGLAIGRILANGALDPGFGTAGRTRVEPAGAHATGNDVVRTPDGGFVAVGHAWPATGDESSSTWLLLKFDSAGKLDQTFGAGGRVDGPAGRALGVAVDGTGRLLVSGESGEQLTVARYLANGAPDASFGSGGVARTGFAGAGEDVLVQPDGRIVAGGTGRAGGRNVMQVVRLQAVGTPTSTGTTDGEIAGPGVPITGPRPGRPLVTAGSVANQQSTGRVTIRIVSSRVTSRGVLVRVTYPLGTDGTARARLWTRDKRILLGQRTVAALPGTRGRTFRVPLNRRAKRMLRGGGLLKVRATVLVTGLPSR